MEEQKDGAVGVLDAPTVAAPEIKPKKKRASKHDFKDGNGRVFAHRHTNGEGWVADTAKVADSVFVHKYAQIYHNARVDGQVHVRNRAYICGYAHVSGNVKLYNYASISGRARVMDDCQLSNEARIYGGIVSGSTTVYDNAFIRDSARVVNCTLRGSCGISGKAIAIQTALEGQAYVGGEAQISSSVLRGFVTVAGKAQVVGSKLMQVSIYSREQSDPTCEMSRLKVVDYAIIANVEQINALLAFRGHAVAAGGHIIFRPAYDANTQNYVRAEVHDDALFAGAVIENITQFAAYNVSRAERRRQNLYTPVSATNLPRPVNMNELIPSRRLMSM
jgi:carbonic anhydrase/acetyltransferase-like protein (isoleucine patch superfamily)